MVLTSVISKDVKQLVLRNSIENNRHLGHSFSANNFFKRQENKEAVNDFN